MSRYVRGQSLRSHAHWLTALLLLGAVLSVRGRELCSLVRLMHAQCAPTHAPIAMCARREPCLLLPPQVSALQRERDAWKSKAEAAAFHSAAGGGAGTTGSKKVGTRGCMAV